MGNSTVIDIMGSILIGGFLLLSVFRLNGTVAQTTFTSGSDLTVQENLVSFVRIIEEDFRKIGYCKVPAKIPDPSKAITGAGQHDIQFLTDVDNDGNVDVVKYWIGSISGAGATPNPRDMMLYRQVNSEPASPLSLGLTKFDFLFFDAQADSLTFPVTVPSAIYSMRLSVILESPFAYDSLYSFAYWRQLRLAARNLKNR